MTTIIERVQAGAAFLDKVLPDWWDGKETPTIDLEILDMGNQRVCILGQCFGWYKRGCEELGITTWNFDKQEGKPSASSLGFLAKSGQSSYSLTDPWRREIKRRRKSA